MTSQPSHSKAAAKAIERSAKDGFSIDPGLTVMLIEYSKMLDKLLFEGPVYKATLLTISQMVEPPNPALVQLAIKLARDLDRNPDGRNASTAKEYRETIKAIQASEAKASEFNDELAQILDGN